MTKSNMDIRNKVKEQLQSKSIVIVGTNIAAQRFYRNNKDKCRIKICLSSYSGHREFLLEEEKDYLVYNFYDYVADEDDYFVIFEDRYAWLENQLLADGNVLFDNFVQGYMAEIAMSSKKVALIAGNCQMGMIYYFLKEISAFTNEYHLFWFPTHRYKSRWSLRSVALLRNMCDLYICMNHDKKDYKFFTSEELPTACKVLTVPYIQMRLLWPQMNMDEGNFFIKNSRTEEHGPFEFADANINAMINKDMSVEEIIQKLSDDTFYDEKFVSEWAENVLHNLEMADAGCDVKLAPYVRENYRKVSLYRDGFHMQPWLVCELLHRLLKILNIEDDELVRIEEQKADNDVYKRFLIHCTEVPIYPSVAKALGLEWIDKDTRYDVTFYNGIRKVTFEEYIREYYNICSMMKTIQEEW